MGGNARDSHCWAQAWCCPSVGTVGATLPGHWGLDAQTSQSRTEHACVLPRMCCGLTVVDGQGRHGDSKARGADGGRNVDHPQVVNGGELQAGISDQEVTYCIH